MAKSFRPFMAIVFLRMLFTSGEYSSAFAKEPCRAAKSDKSSREAKKQGTSATMNRKPQNFVREKRRARWLLARAVADRIAVDCHVTDISRQGAKVSTNLAEKLPARFDLVFASHVVRPCRAVWRRGNNVGVQFV